jgi:hypothetical protein
MQIRDSGVIPGNQSWNYTKMKERKGTDNDMEHPYDDFGHRSAKRSLDENAIS